MDENTAIRHRRGNWGAPDIPTTGWRCVAIVDLGTRTRTCGMCESMMIRYAHTMHHLATGMTTVAGCVCAGHMQGNLETSQSHDGWMRRRARRRMSWLSRVWRLSRAGNSYIKADGFVLTVFSSGREWKAVVRELSSNQTDYTDRRCVDVDDAKLAAFDLVTDLLSKQRVSAKKQHHGRRPKSAGDNPTAPLDGLKRAFAGMMMRVRSVLQ